MSTAGRCYGAVGCTALLDCGAPLQLVRLVADDRRLRLEADEDIIRVARYLDEARVPPPRPPM